MTPENPFIKSLDLFLTGFFVLFSREICERDQKLTSRIEPIQEHCNRTEIKKGFA
jgi:hypothetical protein